MHGNHVNSSGQRFGNPFDQFRGSTTQKEEASVISRLPVMIHQNAKNGVNRRDELRFVEDDQASQWSKNLQEKPIKMTLIAAAMVLLA